MYSKIKTIIYSKYNYINYFFVSTYIFCNLISGREYRSRISWIFILIMLPVFFIKLIQDLKVDKEKNNNNTKETILKMLIVFGLLTLLYVLSEFRIIDQ
jgi:hypothetical protein